MDFCETLALQQIGPNHQRPRRSLSLVWLCFLSDHVEQLCDFSAFCTTFFSFSCFQVAVSSGNDPFLWRSVRFALFCSTVTITSDGEKSVTCSANSVFSWFRLWVSIAILHVETASLRERSAQELCDGTHHARQKQIRNRNEPLPAQGDRWWVISTTQYSLTPVGLHRDAAPNSHVQRRNRPRARRTLTDPGVCVALRGRRVLWGRLTELRVPVRVGEVRPRALPCSSAPDLLHSAHCGREKHSGVRVSVRGCDCAEVRLLQAQELSARHLASQTQTCTWFLLTRVQSNTHNVHTAPTAVRSVFVLVIAHLRCSLLATLHQSQKNRHQRTAPAPNVRRVTDVTSAWDGTTCAQVRVLWRSNGVKFPRWYNMEKTFTRIDTCPQWYDTKSHDVHTARDNMRRG